MIAMRIIKTISPVAAIHSFFLLALFWKTEKSKETQDLLQVSLSPFVISVRTTQKNEKKREEENASKGICNAPKKTFIYMCN